MKTYIALLRGINVSGQKKIKMAELREELSILDFRNIRTYIQSGNIIFDSEESDTLLLSDRIKENIKTTYGFEVPTIVTTKQEVEMVLENNPFLTDKKVDVKQLYVSFLAMLPEQEKIDGIDIDSKNDEYQIIGKAIYLYLPSGAGRTKLTNNFFERKLKVTATTRNWRTINKLVELCGKD